MLEGLIKFTWYYKILLIIYYDKVPSVLDYYGLEAYRIKTYNFFDID